MGWGRVETERSGYGYGGICGHGLAVERKRQRIGLLGQISIGLLGLAVERERQRIGLLGQIVGSCRGKEEVEDWSVGSDRWVLPWKRNGRELACWVLPWKGKGRESS